MSLGGTRREGEIPRDLARGARSRGGEIPGTPALVYLGKAPFLYLNFRDSAF